MTDVEHGTQRRRMPPRTHSNFATRSARDHGQLDRRSPQRSSSLPNEETPLLRLTDRLHSHVRQSHDESGAPLQERDHGIDTMREWFSRQLRPLRSHSPAHADQSTQDGKRPSASEAAKPRPGAFPRPVGGTSKLGTFAGVFVPTVLNVLSILLFLRFGFILGQTGLIGMMAMLIACYATNLLTTMSISAIATNGTVRGGGAYYLISRSLGPEFGGSIGIVFYLGMVFSTSMNAVGLVDCFIDIFGSDTGSWSQWLFQGFWWQFLWATIVLLICTAVCLAGSRLFARCSNALLFLLLFATFSIPVSALVMKPFANYKEGIVFTGPRLETLRSNLMPHFTRGAAGSVHKHRENFRDLFGILFPATGGIFAGASMSGDLKHPSKAIPKGTLYGLGITFVGYTVAIVSLAGTVTRDSLYNNTNVIQLTSISETVILLGEFATASFSVLMGVIGSAKLLQALARDHLIPGLSVFSQGTEKSDDPIYAIFITYVIAQFTMLSDINQIASFITMTYLMTFLVMNLACFLLKIGSAPNFRPSFRFFNWQTAAIGTVVSGAIMFFVDRFYASGCVALLIIIFLLIHYTTPPKPWGDVSQSLIYHQVRKYLLRLRQEHVKFWRPQILLLVNDPRRQYKLIQFCNSLKKGALFVLGHVIVSDDFGAAVPEARRQQQSWTKYIDFSKIKAFVNITISPAVEWGARNIVLGAGLGGMRPNIVVLGFYNLGELRESKPFMGIPSPQPSRPPSRAASHSLSQKAIKSAAAEKRRQIDEASGTLPTDAMRLESAIGIQNYVTMLEDLVSRLQINVALAKGFNELEVPTPKASKRRRALSMLGLADIEDETSSKKYIDLWPIQMSAEIGNPDNDPSRKNVLTTNFDTYTLILQLGCILHTVPSWRRTYQVRVAVFVEYEADVEEERSRVATLLRNLRIEAEVIVFWLASGDLKMYECIINGRRDGQFAQAAEDVDDALEDEDWWRDIQKLRKPQEMSASEEIVQATELLEAVTNWPIASFQHGRRESKPDRFAGLRKMLRRSKSKASAGDLQEVGASIGMRTQRLPADLLRGSESESSESEEGEDAVESTGKIRGSENDLEEYDLDASDDEESDGTDEHSTMPVRRKSTGIGIPFLPTRFNFRKALWMDSPKEEGPASDSATPPNPKPHSDAMATVSDTVLRSGPTARASNSLSASPGSPLAASPRAGAPARPRPMRQHSQPKFTSKTTPHTAIASDEAAGPSIMFVDTPPSVSRKQDPIASSAAEPSHPVGTAASNAAEATKSSATLKSPSPIQPQRPSQPPTRPQAQASGYPAHQSIPLSFNDLPCRAQHLILNELIRQHSDDTAVVFTTLPSPVEGTSESQEDSIKFISDLEVLCQGLPPCLLVHSNSMTVTMNL